MSLYILDTDTLSLFQQGHAAINTRISTLAPGEMAITVLSVEEQILGRFTQVRKARNANELAEAYQHLTETIQMLSGVAILSFTKACRHAVYTTPETETRGRQDGFAHRRRRPRK